MWQCPACGRGLGQLARATFSPEALAALPVFDEELCQRGRETREARRIALTEAFTAAAPQLLLDELAAMGISVYVRGENLYVRPRRLLDASLRSRILARRDGLRALAQDAPVPADHDAAQRDTLVIRPWPHPQPQRQEQQPRPRLDGAPIQLPTVLRLRPVEQESCADTTPVPSLPTRARPKKPTLAQREPALAADRDAAIAHWRQLTGQRPHGGTFKQVEALLREESLQDIIGTIDALWHDIDRRGRPTGFWQTGNMSWYAIGNRIAAYKAGRLRGRGMPNTHSAEEV